MRLFLAVDIPDAIRGALGSLQERLADSWHGWRWARPESIHLTIRFLGEVGDDLNARARQSWRAAAAPSSPFAIRLGGIGRFPRAGKARVLWIAIDEIGEGGSLQALAGRVEMAARELGFEPEKRPFMPHLTLARAARGERPHWSAGLELDRGDVVRVDRLALFRSQLHPTGARYTELEQFKLEGGNE